MCRLLRDYPKKVYLGKDADGTEFYLSSPTWDCGWYWEFGYVGNDDLHTHLDMLGDYFNAGNKDLHYVLSNYLMFGWEGQVWDMHKRDKLWEFCEIVMSIYELRKAAEVLGRGGSHYTTNPLSELIKNTAEVKRINDEVIPELIDHMYVLLGVVEPVDNEEDE